ncbi:bisanhydrobacterioruberin hydratase CruF [Frankia sp. R82]|uniref:bisanhydrobacterioruberin hydratase CruF n=1 Tax=Frankia sp. R82 TaxID=2950553 RepID=UPI002043B92F|nr:bisanhydrobacterioruberin hydratase CruF [Frankia sp. R82]MCM3886423.1 carotenoid biosynthesis protein [Frankia sp. R82]
MSGRHGAGLVWPLVVATVAAQIAYPVLPDRALDALTVIIVVLFFLASATHAATSRGWVWTTGYLAIAVGGGLAVEILGVHTGIPFGHYTYGASLGPHVLGVVMVIPLAWAMMAYPAYVLVRRHRRAPGRAAVVGGLILAAWDLFLDPQMVDAGHWTWAPGGGPALNGIPISNFLGWLLVGTVMTGVLLALPERDRSPGPEPGSGSGSGSDRAPLVLLAWTYLSSVLANLSFFGRPGVAAIGGAAMGAALLLALRRWRCDESAAGEPVGPQGHR